eukprot:6196581-Pleurochrysis_carterae.AAC.2
MRASTLRAAVDDADRTALSNAPVDVEPELSELSEELEAAMNSSSVLVDEVAESAAVSTGETDIASAPAGASELPKSVKARADSVFLQQAEQILADDDDASAVAEKPYWLHVPVCLARLASSLLSPSSVGAAVASLHPPARLSTDQLRVFAAICDVRLLAASSDKERRALKEKLLQLAAVTDRGQAAKYKV